MPRRRTTRLSKRLKKPEEDRVYNDRGQDMGKKYPGMSLRMQRMFSGGMY